MITVSAYDTHVEKLFDRMKRLHSALCGAGIPISGHWRHGVYLHVSEWDPGKARLHAMWTWRGIHLVFAGEKVRPKYLEPVPGFSQPTQTAEGILIAPVLDLVTMKLTRLRLKDQVHIQDLDSVGLIPLRLRQRFLKRYESALSKYGRANSFSGACGC